jgi:ribosomal protein L35
VTATGKLMRAAQKSGKLMHKSPKQKRQFSKDRPVDAANQKAVSRLLGRR